MFSVRRHRWRKSRWVVCRFGHDPRAGVALFAALATPVVLMAVGLGVDIARWAVVSQDVQRAADIAALAGGDAWDAYPSEVSNLRAVSPCTTPSQSCLAAVAAADMAEVNGADGTSSRTWSWNGDGTVGTLEDGSTTVVVSTGSANQGLHNSSDPIVRVTVSETVPIEFSGILTHASTETIKASAITEMESTSQGPQPCLLALSLTGTGISGSGSTYINAIGCSIRSNAAIGIHGGGGIESDGVYAAGAASIDSWIPDTNNNGQSVTPVSNAGTIPDPYASNTALQTALQDAASASGTAINCNDLDCGLPTSSGGGANGSYCGAQSGEGAATTCYLQPGDYSGFNISGGGCYTFDLQPGLYVFNGNFNVSGTCGTISGNGVTIVTTGTFNGTSTFNFDISAPDALQVDQTGGIAGIALAGSTSGTVSISGSANLQVNGVIYFPAARFTAGGYNNTSGPGCTELIAASITLSGYSSVAGNCSSLGAASFGSTDSSGLATLVQ
jgi:Putative Flp pilus-assembly TadE/G-like